MPKFACDTVCYLVLVHGTWSAPVSIEGPFTLDQCVALHDERLQPGHEGLMFARKGMAYTCLSLDQVQFYADYNHCVGTPSHTKDGAKILLEDCLGP